MQEPKQVADGVEEIVKIIQGKSPRTEIVLLGVFPRGGNSFDSTRLNNVAINQYLQRMSVMPKVHYVDLSAVFLEPDGRLRKEIMPDLLHLSPVGYRLWAEALEPELKKLGM